MASKGVFTLSIDVELVWGVFDLPDAGGFLPAITQVRAIVADLLGLFEKYGISATWAVVGHLFLDRCERQDGTIHPEITRPNHAWFPYDWFRDDPGTDCDAAPLWYGLDLVRAVREATPLQEIGLHSFCHMIYGDPGCSREAAACDLWEACCVARAHGIAPVSFVFPRDLPGHLDLLAAHGFLCYRGEPSWWFRNLPGRRLVQAGHLLDDFLGLPSPTVRPRLEDCGLVNIPGSMLFRHARGIRRIIPAMSRVRKARAGIQRAIARGEVFHLHFHPWNFGWSRGTLMAAFSRILKIAVAERDAGRLEILSMGEVARRVLASQPPVRGTPHSFEGARFAEVETSGSAEA